MLALGDCINTRSTKQKSRKIIIFDSHSNHHANGLFAFTRPGSWFVGAFQDSTPA